MGVASILAAKDRAVITVGPDVMVSEIVSLLNRENIGMVVVLEGGMVIGVVSERDIVRELGSGRADLLSCSAREVMTAPVVTISPQENVGIAMALMTQKRIRHLPVVEGGVLLGLISIGDLVKQRIASAVREADDLRDYILSS